MRQVGFESLFKWFMLLIDYIVAHCRLYFAVVKEHCKSCLHWLMSFPRHDWILLFIISDKVRAVKLTHQLMH